MSTFPPFDGSAPKQQKFSSPPEMGIDPSKRYTATMETSMGTIVIALDPINAPKTTNNFVFLALNHYYDGIVFHRVVKDFVIQGGDPEGTGLGGPGYRFEDELPARFKYLKGAVAMANSGPNTNGSQFFLCSTDLVTPKVNELPPLYSLFGQVVKGIDVVDAINAIGNSGKVPTSPLVVIDSVTITVAD